MANQLTEDQLVALLKRRDQRAARWREAQQRKLLRGYEEPSFPELDDKISQRTFWRRLNDPEPMPSKELPDKPAKILPFYSDE